MKIFSFVAYSVCRGNIERTRIIAKTEKTLAAVNVCLNDRVDRIYAVKNRMLYEKQNDIIDISEKQNTTYHGTVQVTIKEDKNTNVARRNGPGE